MHHYNQPNLGAACRKGSLNQIYDALNFLGNCSWMVNQPILKLMLALFNDQGDMRLDIIGPNLPELEKLNSK